MQLIGTTIPGVKRVIERRNEDERGSFARTFDAEVLAAGGSPFAVCQVAHSVNPRRGTLRGMHWQAEPHADAKIVRCLKGRLFDVVADIRPESPAFSRWQGFELTPDSGAILVPAGLAHGFQTLEDDTELLYLIGAPFKPLSATGFRFDDPAFGIDWPLPVAVISTRDRSFAPFSP
jgi:dTDP-4-dehydrorhamnose 3,5-epimerase